MKVESLCISYTKFCDYSRQDSSKSKIFWSKFAHLKFWYELPNFPPKDCTSFLFHQQYIRTSIFLYLFQILYNISLFNFCQIKTTVFCLSLQYLIIGETEIFWYTYWPFVFLWITCSYIRLVFLICFFLIDLKVMFTYCVISAS